MKKHSLYLVFGTLVAFASCTKKTTSPSGSSNNNNNNTGVTINSTTQFTGTIGGTNYSLVNGSNYTSGVGNSKSIGGSGATSNSAEYFSYIVDNATSTKGLNVNKGTITFPLSSNTPDSVSFKAFFAPGTYSYSVNYVNGIEVTWTDPSGVMWSTSNGTGSQTGSTFKITAEQSSTVFGYQYVKILANFSCTLYNAGGTSMQLTNGVYVGDFEND